MPSFSATWHCSNTGLALLQCLGLRESKKKNTSTNVVKLTSFTNEVKVQGKARGAKRKGITKLKCLMRELGHKPNLNVMVLHAEFALRGFRQHKN
jgi:hypothetical protein